MPDPFEDTPENRERLQRAAETYADMQGTIYTLIRSKKSGKLGVQPKSVFDPAKDEILFECSGGGRRAADARWEEIERRLREADKSN